MDRTLLLNVLISLVSGALAGGITAKISLRNLRAGRDNYSGKKHKNRSESKSRNSSTSVKQRVKNGDAIGRDKNSWKHS